MKKIVRDWLNFLKHRWLPMAIGVGLFVAIGGYFSLSTQQQQDRIQAQKRAEEAVVRIERHQDENTERIEVLLREVERQGRVVDCILQLHVEENVPVPATEIAECRRVGEEPHSSQARPAPNQPNPQPNPQPQPTPPDEQGLLDRILGMVGL